jgi:hypothetical protein
VFKKLTDNLLKQRQQVRDEELYRNLMRHEARIGGTLFGPVPKGHRREFFCLDEHTWIWHEEWTDKDGKKQIRTTRYDVRPNGVLKAQDGQPYRYLGEQEAQHLLAAVDMYIERVDQEIYQRV